MTKDVTRLTDDQLRDIAVLSSDVISVLTAKAELRRRGAKVPS